MRWRRTLIHFGSAASSNALQLMLSVVTARLLTPRDLGVFGIAAGLAAMAHAVRDLGVSAYLQREPDLRPGQLRSALGLSCASALGLAVLLPLVGAGLAAWLRMPALPPLVGVLSLGLLVVPVGAVNTALALRVDDARTLARVTAWGSLVHALGALALIGAGLGVHALAWAQVLNLAACSLLHWRLRPRGLWGAPRLGGWRAILDLGRGTVMLSLLNALHQASPAWLLARWGGAARVGLLGRAQSLVGLLPGLAGMAMQFGAIGRLARAHHQGVSLAPRLLRSAAILTGLMWPMLAVVAVLAEPLLRLLFGPGWGDAAAAVPALALLTALALVFNDSPAALTAIGRPALAALPLLSGLFWRWALGLALVSMTGAVGATPALRVDRFAAALLAAGFLTLPPQLWIAARFLGLAPRALRRALAPSAAVAICAGLAAWAGVHGLPAQAPAGVRVLAGLVAAVSAGIASLRPCGHVLGRVLGRVRGGVFQWPPASGRRRITIRK